MQKYFPYIVMLVIAAIAVVIYHKYFNKPSATASPNAVTPLPGTATNPINTGLEFYTDQMGEFQDVA